MQTIEQLSAKMEAEHAAITKHQAAYTGLRIQYEKLVRAKADQEPLTFERAMNVYVEGTRVEFEAGRKFIEKLNSSEWHRAGLMYLGEHFHNTNQRVLKLLLDYRFDAAQMSRLETLVRDILPVLKSGTALEGTTVLINNSGKDAPIDLNTLKLFHTLTHDCGETGNPALGVLPDGSAIVFDQYRPKWGLEKRGTIAECLEYLRENHWYQGGDRNYDDGDD